MGFFASGAGSAPTAGSGASKELLHKLECRACPLDKVKGNLNPHMPATGSSKPLVYVLGEAPGKNEDEKGRQFVGASGRYIRPRIPRRLLDSVRWNNVVRTRPPGNRDPEWVEIECCRPSVERDIARTKPKLILGFGNYALEWAAPGKTGVQNWRGRRMPVKIAGHSCWFYPMLHPSFILHEEKKSNRQRRSDTDIVTEFERAFVFDLERALHDVEEGLPLPVVHTTEMAEANLELLTGAPGDLQRLKRLFVWAENQRDVGFDYETKGLRPYADDAAILSVGIGTGERAFSFAWDHPGALWSKAERKIVWRLFLKFMWSRVRKLVHALGFEMEWTGVKIDKRLLRGTKWGDSIVQASVIDERTGRGEGNRKRKEGPLSLNFLVQQYFGFNLKTMSPLDKNDLSNEPVMDVLRYNAMDARYHWFLFHAQDEVLSMLRMQRLYKEALRRVPTCVLTQIRGVYPNAKATRRLQAKYLREIEAAEEKIAALEIVQKYKRKFGKVFKPGSPADVARVYRDMLKREEGYERAEHMAARGKGKKGKYSTDDEVLSVINDDLAKLILRYRKYKKLESTYLYTEVWPDGKLHPIFNTVLTETERLSCEDPNLQNVPKRDKEAKEVRTQIKAPRTRKFQLIINAHDYGQIEARTIAMASRDKRFVKALWERYDVHLDWAQRIAYEYPRRVGGKKFIKDPDAIKAFRADIKNEWTFPLFFGAQLKNVAEIIKVPEDVLRPLHDQFWNEFEGVAEWQERLLKFYRQNGYVETLCGRRRHAPLSRNQVINSPIQATAQEIILDGMCRISELADKLEDDYLQPNINIHDDLTFIQPAEKTDYYADIIIREMLKVDHFKFINVPITIEMSMGQDMAHMEEVLRASSDGLWEWKNGNKWEPEWRKAA